MLLGLLTVGLNQDDLLYLAILPRTPTLPYVRLDPERTFFHWQNYDLRNHTPFRQLMVL